MKTCCECKTEIGMMEPSMMSADGEHWHLYCYHTRSDCKWFKVGDAWARDVYKAPAALTR